MNTIESLSNLPWNWNSYGSRPVLPQVIRKAKEILAMLSGWPQPLIFPVAGGGLQFEWHTKDHELEVEILPDLEVVYLFVEGDQITESGDI